MGNARHSPGRSHYQETTVSPDPTALPETLAPADDGMSAPASVPALHPDDWDDWDDAETEIARAQTDVDAAVGAVISDVDAALFSAAADVNGAFASVIGTVDADLAAVAAPAENAVAKLAGVTLESLYYQESDMRNVGVAVPYSESEQSADLDDTTGTATLDRLTGLYPGQVAPDDGMTLPPPPPPAPSAPTGDATAYVPASPPPPGSPPAPLAPPAPACPECEAARTVASTTPPPATTPGYIPPPPCPAGYHVEYTAAQPFGECVPDAVTLGSPPPPAPPPPYDPRTDVPAPIRDVLPPPVAPPPPAPPPLLDYGTPGWGVAWSYSNVCANIDAALKYRPASVTTRAGKTESAISDVTRIAEYIAAPALDGFRFLTRLVNGESLTQASGITAASLAGISIGAGMIAQLWGTLAPISVPDPDGSAYFAVKLGIADRAEGLTGVPLSYLMQTERYLLQYGAPQYIPSQAEIDTMYLSNRLSTESWTCLTRAQGNIPEARLPLIGASETRPGVHEVLDLFQRGKLDPAWTLRERLRELGIIDPRRDAEYVALHEWIPQPPDLVRFMLRDVFDPAAVKEGNLDKDFALKFFGPGGRDDPGPAAKWAAAHGVTPETMILFWRAHWEWPSPTQLYECLHRLRKDRPEYQAWLRRRDEWETSGRTIVLPPEPPSAPNDEVRNVLEINDIAPAWIDRLMAVSYRPLNRTDGINAFMAQAMSADELYHVFRDNGYDDKTAKRMIEIQQLLRNRRLSNVSGVWSARKIVSAYQRGELDRVGADKLLTDLMPSQDQRDRVLDGADAEVQARILSATIKRLRRLYFVGENTREKTVELLINFGVGIGRSRDLADEWTEDLRGRYKEPTARLIVSWCKDQIITAEDALDRLRRIGYILIDAQRILYQGLLAAQDKVIAAVEKRAAAVERAIKSQKQAAKEETAALKDRQKELEKQKKALEDEQKRIEKELADRRPNFPR